MSSVSECVLETVQTQVREAVRRTVDYRAWDRADKDGLRVTHDINAVDHALVVAADADVKETLLDTAVAETCGGLGSAINDDVWRAAYHCLDAVADVALAPSRACNRAIQKEIEHA